jgi:hypothetical protein
MKKLPSQYDPAIVGVVQVCGEPNRLVYSEQGIIDILTEEMSDLSREDILEHYEVNFLQVGIEGGPGFLIDVDEDPFLNNGDDEIEELQV